MLQKGLFWVLLFACCGAIALCSRTKVAQARDGFRDPTGATEQMGQQSDCVALLQKHLRTVSEDLAVDFMFGHALAVLGSTDMELCCSCARWY